MLGLDVLPTALAAAGVTAMASEFDGVNPLPFLTGTAKAAPHDALYWRLGGMMAIRKGDWKLVKTHEGPLTDVDPSALNDLSDAGLYNLAEDIGEARNRAAEHPDKVKELRDLWQRWNRQLAKPLWGLDSAVGEEGPRQHLRVVLNVRDSRSARGFSGMVHPSLITFARWRTIPASGLSVERRGSDPMPCSPRLLPIRSPARPGSTR